MSTFECQSCGRSFAVLPKTLEKYPTWQPKKCLRCHSAIKTASAKPSHKAGRPGAGPPTGGAATTRAPGLPERDLTVSEVLKTYSGGPSTGVFTDGAAHPNPGRGGWGAVYVIDNQIIAQDWGSELETTNNRMELTGILAGYRLVPLGQAVTVMTDSELCVNTINTWAAEWEKQGWKRKRGAIKNLDLVQELYRVARARPEIELRWIKSHNGYLWNEYADALATAYRRSEL